MKIPFFLFLLIISYSIPGIAQFNPEAGIVFDDTVVPRIDVEIHPDSLAWILDDENLSSDQLFRVNFTFDNGNIQETHENVGFRLRGNTSRSADKKSFKLDFNAFESGRKFYGLEKINLNGQHNDPSISRAKISSDLGIFLGIPMMRTNHVRLYINDEYRGVYLNVEHIDEEFAGERFDHETGQLYKCLWPADLTYKGSDPEEYQESYNGRRAYDLKNKTVYQDYSDIAEFIQVLNQTSDIDFPCAMEEVFNTDSYLKAIVFDILTGNWDGPIYNKNNFYLYHNDFTGLFEYIPFDLDNTLGIDWVNKDWGNRNIYSWAPSNDDRPLYSRLMENDVFRSRFNFYMQQALDEFFNEDVLFSYLDEMHDKIVAYVEEDPFYPLDYGFSIDDFTGSFNYASLPYFQTDYSLKDYIETRKASIENQLESTETPPIISDIQDNNAFYSHSVKITSNVLDDQSINQVKLCYFYDSEPIECVDMKDDGIAFDSTAGDGIYSVELDPMYKEITFSYHIEAYDNDNNVAISPCSKRKIYIQNENINLVINEIMAKNDNIINDAYGERNDWIELFNRGQNPISLIDKFLSDDSSNPTKWKLPNVVISPNEYVIIWADDNTEQGKFHSNFKLAASAGYLSLVDRSDNELKVLDIVEYDEQSADISWSRIPNGTGPFQFDGPTPRKNNEGISSLNEYPIQFSIYPNPAQDFIVIDLQEENNKGRLNIMNALGYQVYETQLSDSKIRVDLSNFPKGIYICTFTQENNISISKKFVNI